MKDKVIAQPVLEEKINIDEMIKMKAKIEAAPLDVLYQILNRLDRIIELLENR